MNQDSNLNLNKEKTTEKIIEKDINIILKSGAERIYKNIADLNIYAGKMTFKVIWKSLTGEIDFKKYTFIDYAGYGLTERHISQNNQKTGNKKQNWIWIN